MVALMQDVESAIIQSGQLGIWWTGQAGYILKTCTGKVVFVDTYLSGGNARMIPPPLEPEEIECDLYICTHNHSDHTDLETIMRVKNRENTVFLGPRNVAKALREHGVNPDKIREVNVGDSVQLEGLRVTGTFCIPTDDTVLDTIGLLLQTEDGVTVYHSGDTGFHDFLYYLSKNAIDVMMVCINGGMGNMDIEEAIRLTRLLRPRVVIPNHYGMFAGNTADPILFRTRLTATRAEPPCQILRIGESYTYTKPQQ